MGWISAIRLFGDIFDLEGFYILHLIFVVFMCMTWFILAGLTALAFWRGEILFAREEDVVRDTRHWTHHMHHNLQDVEKAEPGPHSG